VVVKLGRVRAGEDVLVLAASSGVGHLAIQLAKASGARVIATAGNEEKLAQARALGADETINHYTEDIAARVKALTGGRGVDLVAEQVGTPVWPACMMSLKPWGRLVTCGVTAGHRVELHLGAVFVQGTQIMGVGRPDAHAVRETMLNLLRMASLGQVRPVIHATFPLREEADAHGVMERSSFFGKVVLNP
jgi:NADPH:quinone reductase-like Zn-dependent oxidoreductase